MQEHKNFWDKNAGRYDRFMRKDRAAYDEMYALIRPVVRHKTVLELAAGRRQDQIASNRLLANLAEKPAIHRDNLIVFA